MQYQTAQPSTYKTLIIIFERKHKKDTLVRAVLRPLYPALTHSIANNCWVTSSPTGEIDQFLRKDMALQFSSDKLKGVELGIHGQRPIFIGSRS